MTNSKQTTALLEFCHLTKHSTGPKTVLFRFEAGPELFLELSHDNNSQTT